MDKLSAISIINKPLNLFLNSEHTTSTTAAKTSLKKLKWFHAACLGKQPTSSLIFQFLSFLQGTAHRVTELLAGRLGRDKVILNHPVASIKQVKIKVTVTILGRHDLLLLMS